MTERRDKLGRRIPDFDRSAAAKKGVKTQRRKHGSDFHAKIGRIGGKHSHQRYFAKLKEENPELLKKIQARAVKNSPVTKKQNQILPATKKAGAIRQKNQRSVSGRRTT